MSRSLIIGLLALVLTAPATGDEAAYRQRLLGMEEDFSARYMELAKRAKRYRYPDLAQTFVPQGHKVKWLNYPSQHGSKNSINFASTTDIKKIHP